MLLLVVWAARLRRTSRREIAAIDALLAAYRREA
jgi:hypothetical protein